ncbi:MAG: carboxymuconolactone decarboxylase family protein [Saprospiraceae bacterium]
MATFTVPTRATVTPTNQAIFDNLEKGLGFVPNIYATLALNETALPDYLAFQGRKSTLKAKEKEVINLAVSQVNGCSYCLAAHTAIGQMNGFNEEQILGIRRGEVTFDPKVAALATFAKETTINRGKPTAAVTDALLAAGYTQANLVDIIMVIGDKVVSNFLHGVTQVPVDFPAAVPLEEPVLS